MTYRRISVEPLTPAIGAEISSVDLREPLEDETYAEIRRALLAHGVIFFRDQPIDHEQHLAFGRRFGGSAHPSRLALRGWPARAHAGPHRRELDAPEWPPVAQRRLLRRGAADGLGAAPAHGAGVRRGHPVLEHVRGMGRALGADEGAARARSKPRHESAHLYDHLYGDAMVRRRNEWPSAVHPVVRTHPETGRKALFVNCHLHPAYPRRQREREPRAARVSCSST